jgi:hypothetical protein
MATIYNLEKSITIKIYRDCSTAVPEWDVTQHHEMSHLGEF